MDNPLPGGDEGVNDVQLRGALALLLARAEQEEVEVDPALDLKPIIDEVRGSIPATLPNGQYFN